MTTAQGQTRVLKIGPKDFTVEHIAVAVLVERLQNLPKESYNDLMTLSSEIATCETPEECFDIMETMREIMFPEIVGELHLGNKIGSLTQTASIQSRCVWIGTKIKEKRQALHLTQEELAEKSDLPQSHISRLEGGKHSPSRKTLEKIAKALGIDIGDLDPNEPVE